MNNILLSYFEYLRDTSKNLTTSGDMYRCLIPKFTKTLKNSVCETTKGYISAGIINKDDAESKHFISYLSQIKKEVNRQVYLGVGYIIGSFNKKIFGSIVNIPVIFEEEDFLGGKLKYTFDYNEISLNYDLISSLLPDYFISEMDGTAQDILFTISKFENEIKNIKSIDTLEFKINEFIESILKTNKNIIIEFLKEDISHANLSDNQNKEAIINKKDYFYRHDKYNFFIANIPDAISTWKNLNSFCNEIKNNNFKSNVLKEFFSNIFNIKNFTKEVVLEKQDYRNTIEHYLPISLSKNQKIAINNCFNSKISYVQGPPGTGKSHTISGILLASFLLGKKVLVVAQKNNALDVVKNKISKFYDENLSVPFIYFNKEDKVELKNNLISLCNQNLPEKSNIELLDATIKKQEEKLTQHLNNLESKVKILTIALNQHADYYEQNIDLIHSKEIVFNNPIYHEEFKEKIKPSKTDNIDFLENIKNIENKYIEFECITKYDEIKLLKLQEKFNNYFNFKNIIFLDLIKNNICYGFLKEWMELTWKLGYSEELNNKLTKINFISSLKYEITTIKNEIKIIQEILYKLYHKKKLYLSLLDDNINAEIQRFGKMLHWNRGDKVIEKMDQIDYEKLLEAYPIWLSEIKNIGEILPNKAELFDLVIVDEASQVNLAEILPIFYRAKNICIVGDHKQLGLNASGLSFSLSRKFDKIIWNKYKPNNFDFDTANYRNLTITKASILDLLRSEENKETFKYIMLDEHYRSLPGLSSFNNKEFYENKLKIMTEVPDKSLVSCFAAIKVTGVKDNKINTEEAKEVINTIKYIINKELNQNKKEEYKNKIKLNCFVPKIPTIGIISSVRDQVEYIKELLEEFSEEEFLNHRLICGTPEEFQGDEFDIVVISTTTDEDSRNNGHYANENRFNVATSRSRFYTIFIYSNVNKIPIYEKYLQHFGLSGKKITPNDNILGWNYSESKNNDFNSFFIKSLDEINKEIEKECNIKIKLFNQINSCGQKPITFVLYNEDNKKFLGIEINGIYDKISTTDIYAQEYLSKIEVLEKAGWKIIDTPYNIWYENGLLNLTSEKYLEEIKRLKNEILNNLK